MGYTLDEIKGKHHSMFADEAYAQQRRIPRILGQAQSRRIPGRRIQDASAKAARKSGFRLPTTRSSTSTASPSRSSSTPPTSPRRKIPTPTTPGKSRRSANRKRSSSSEWTAPSFSANENFLRAMGYMADEIKGKHHSMFVEENYRNSPDYREFWAKLNRGEYPERRIQAHRQRRQRSLDSGFLQSDSRSERQAVQGRQIRQRHHAAKSRCRRVAPQS